MTEYRDIPGYPGYRVGADGTVWSCWRRGKTEARFPWRKLAIRHFGPMRYLGTRLHRNGKGRVCYIHQIVLWAFVGPRPPGLEACHNDGNRFNNAPTNLRWDTSSANKKDGVRHGTVVGRILHKPEVVLEIRRLRKAGLSYTQIASRTGVSTAHIGRVLNGQHRSNVYEKTLAESAPTG